MWRALICCFGLWGHSPLWIVGRGVADPFGPAQVPQPGDSSMLLIADHGNDRVVEVDVSGIVTGGPLMHIGYVGAGTGTNPRAVAANASHIAVSGWTLLDCGSHCVTLYDAISRDPVRTLGLGIPSSLSGDGTAAPGALWCPYGLRFNAEGTRLMVTSGKACVSVYDVESGDWQADVATAAVHDLSLPRDVVQVGASAARGPLPRPPCQPALAGRRGMGYLLLSGMTAGVG